MSSIVVQRVAARRSLLVVAALAWCAVACGKSTATATTPASDAAAGASSEPVLTLVPILDPPESEAAAPLPRVVAPAAPGFGYTDSDDLPGDAGTDARCPPSTTKPREVVVRLEHVTQPKPTIDLVIPALSLRKRLWPVFPGNGNPNSCRTDVRRDAVGFTCSEVMTGTTGKVYARGSDVVLGQSTTEGTKQTRFALPCGSVARFERSPCPPRCFSGAEGQCECTELAPGWRTPSPVPTTSGR